MKKVFYLSLALASMLAMNSCKPSDEKITEAVTKEASADASLATVSYSVKEGVVTLSGEVENEEIKKAAEEKFKAVEGVKSVVNNLTVKPVVVLPTPEEIKKQADDALTVLVSNALSGTGVTGITATVQDSVVSLTGDVKKADLKKVMEAAMSVTPKKVDNKLNIIK